MIIIIKVFIDCRTGNRIAFMKKSQKFWWCKQYNTPVLSTVLEYNHKSPRLEKRSEINRKENIHKPLFFHQFSKDTILCYDTNVYTVFNQTPSKIDDNSNHKTITIITSRRKK